MSYPSTLATEDFMEMLKRRDSVEEVAQYAGVRVASLERRFQRLPNTVQKEIIRCRGESLHWWQAKTRQSPTLAQRNRERMKTRYLRRLQSDG